MRDFILCFPEYKTIWWNVYQLLNSNNEESEFFFTKSRWLIKVHQWSRNVNHENNADNNAG